MDTWHLSVILSPELCYHTRCGAGMVLYLHSLAVSYPCVPESPPFTSLSASVIQARDGTWIAPIPVRIKRVKPVSGFHKDISESIMTTTVAL